LDGSTQGPKQPLIAQLSENYTPVVTLSMRNRGGSTPTQYILDLCSFANAQHELAQASIENRENQLRRNVIETVMRLRASERSSIRFGYRTLTSRLGLFRKKNTRRPTFADLLIDFPPHETKSTQNNNPQSNVTNQNHIKESADKTSTINQEEKKDNNMEKSAANKNNNHKDDENKKVISEDFTKEKQKQTPSNESSSENDALNNECKTNNALPPNEIESSLLGKRKSTTIQILDLYRCTKLTNKSLSEIALKCADSIRILDLSYCLQITDSSVACLAKCRFLEDLR
jgi:hypothetical protein